MVGIEHDGLGAGRDRRLDPSGSLERIAKIGPGVGKIGLQYDGFFERCDGLVDPPKTEERVGEIGMKGRRFGVLGDCLLDQLDGKRKIAPLVGDDTQEMERVGMRGIGGQDRAIDRLGAHEIAALVGFEALGEGSGDCENAAAAIWHGDGAALLFERASFLAVHAELN